MGFMTPFKKRANSFTYIPRYYDPEREAFNQRRAELFGERAGDSDREYVPGQYIRTQREARTARRQNEKSDNGHTRIIILCALAAIIMLFAYRLYPVIVSALSDKPSKAAAAPAYEEEFDPYAPIVIIPND
ncbi:MAG: hypothetical protein J1D86_02120 [Alistipes sp.]|nr:hypothetical protein [Alistipes sp.]